MTYRSFKPKKQNFLFPDFSFASRKNIIYLLSNNAVPFIIVYKKRYHKHISIRKKPFTLSCLTIWLLLMLIFDLHTKRCHKNGTLRMLLLPTAILFYFLRIKYVSGRSDF